MLRLLARPDFRGIFYKEDGKGGWRVPSINESCCVRTALADLMDAVAAQVQWPQPRIAMPLSRDMEVVMQFF